MPKRNNTGGLFGIFGLFGGDSHRRAVEGIKREYVRSGKRHRRIGAATSAGTRDIDYPPKLRSAPKARTVKPKRRRLNGREQLEAIFGPAPKRNPTTGRFVRGKHG